MRNLSYELLNSIFSDSPDAILIVDQDRKIVAANTAFEQLFGYSEAEVLGRSGEYLYADKKEFEAHSQTKFTKKNGVLSLSINTEGKHRDGSSIHCEVHLSLIREPDSDSFRYIITVQDISPNIRGLRLIESVSSILAQAGEGYLSKITDILRAGIAHFELENATIARIEDGKFFPVIKVDKIHALRGRQAIPLANTLSALVYDSDEPMYFHERDAVDWTADRATDETLGFSVNAFIGAPLHVDRLRYGVVVFYSDEKHSEPFDDFQTGNIKLIADWIGEQLREHQHATTVQALDAQLRENERRYRYLYRTTPGVLFTLDPEGIVADVSDRWVSATGFSRFETIGRKVEDVLLDAGGTPVMRTVMGELWSNGFVDQQPLEIRQNSGDILEIELSAILDDSGQSLVVLEDVGERNAAHRALEEKNAELEHVNIGLKQFAYVASHDLQEPLRKIRTYGEMLEQAAAEQDQAEMERSVSVIGNASRRASSLVSSLLAYTRITNRPMALNECSLEQAVSDVVDDLSELIRSNNVKVSIAVPNTTIRADQSALRQLLQNLISNAIKYSHSVDQPAVDISAEHTDTGMITLSVSDNGIGFDPRYAQTIFEPFKRLHLETEIPGTGIGLAICAKVAERHGWQLSATSSPQKGARFQVDIDPPRLTEPTAVP